MWSRFSFRRQTYTRPLLEQARVGEPAGALHRFVEHGIQVEARVDSQDGGDAFAQHFVLLSLGIGLPQISSSV